MAVSFLDPLIKSPERAMLKTNVAQASSAMSMPYL